MNRRWFLTLLSLGITGTVVAQRRGKRPEPPQRMGSTPAPPELREVVAPDTQANRALLAAVRRNDPKAVEKAFEQGANPNATLTYRQPGERTDGNKPMPPIPVLRMVRSHPGDNAFRLRAVAIFRQFLKRGFNLKATDETGDNAVLWALMLEDVDLVREVLDKGADVNAVIKTPYGGDSNAVNHVLMLTLAHNEARTLPLLKLVLERGADPNVYGSAGMTPLHNAALMGVPRTVELLLRHGANPTLPTRPQPHGSPGGSLPANATPLILARRSGNDEVIRLLVAAKGDLDPVEAATTGSVAALRKHLDAGISSNQKDASGTPFLVLAAASGNADAVRLLLEHKADPDARGKQGTTALHRAALLGHTECVRALLDGGANPNAISGRAEYPDTPLTRAIEAAATDVVALLLERGVDLSAPGNRDALMRLVQNAGGMPRRPVGKSPKAIRRGDAALDAQSRIYDLLIARMDVRKVGGAALCMAVEREQFGIAYDLIERGVEVNARDREGKSVVMLTVESIGANRSEMSPEMLKMQDLSPQEVKELRQETAARDAEAMRFLGFLLAKKPDVNVVAPPGPTSEGGTALSIARFWSIKDVATLLKNAGARR